MTSSFGGKRSKGPIHTQVHEGPEFLGHRQLERLPHLGLRAPPRILGVEPRRREYRIEVLGDHVRFVDHAIAVHQRRHHAVGIQREVLRPLLLHLREVDGTRLPVEPLLEQHDAYAPRARRTERIVQGDAIAHVRDPSTISRVETDEETRIIDPVSVGFKPVVDEPTAI